MLSIGQRPTEAHEDSTGSATLSRSLLQECRTALSAPGLCGCSMGTGTALLFVMDCPLPKAEGEQSQSCLRSVIGGIDFDDVHQAAQLC
jgi:hypothetical protein